MGKDKLDIHIRQKIANTIRSFRLKNKLNQEEVAEYLNISAAQIGFMENGLRGVTVHNLIQLAHLYDCNIDDFIGVDDYSPTPINLYNTTLKALNFSGESEINFIKNFIRDLKKYIKLIQNSNKENV